MKVKTNVTKTDATTTFVKILTGVLSVTGLAVFFWPQKKSTFKLDESLPVSRHPTENDIKQAIKSGRVAEMSEKQAGLAQR